MFRKLLLAVFSLLVSVAHANYSANLAGNVTAILTYPDGTLLFVLSNQPSSNGSCGAAYFEVDPPPSTASDAALNRMYARIAQAYATGEAVNIGYDNGVGASPACGGYGYIKVWRIG